MNRKQTLGRRTLGKASLVTRGLSGTHMEVQGLWTKTGLTDR